MVNEANDDPSKGFSTVERTGTGDEVNTFQVIR
jgi:hypothetical protein